MQLKKLQPQVVVLALAVADRRLADDQPRDLEGRPGADGLAGRRSPETASVDRLVVDPAVAGELGEGPDARGHLVAAPQRHAVAVQVAVGLAERLAVAKWNRLVDLPPHGTLEAERGGAEALCHACAEAALQDLPAAAPDEWLLEARLLRRETADRLDVDRGVAQRVEPQAQGAVDLWPVGGRGLEVAIMRAAQDGAQGMALPVAVRQQAHLRLEQRRAAARVGDAVGVGVVASGHLDGGAQRHGADPHAERIERLEVLQPRPAAGGRDERRQRRARADGWRRRARHGRPNGALARGRQVRDPAGGCQAGALSGSDRLADDGIAAAEGRTRLRGHGAGTQAGRRRILGSRLLLGEARGHASRHRGKEKDGAELSPRGVQ